VACNLCLQTGCPAISLTSDDKAQIDSVICNGCPICEQVCKLDAITEIPNDQIL
jgi:indolepyruvate ferredoxin oxidoreductase alpha subunit